MRIEPLAHRKTRLKLLLSSYLDACEAKYDETEITAGATDRMPARNEELWPWGSYKALERCLDDLRASDRSVYRSTWLKWVVKTTAHGERADRGLSLLADAMPRFIYVPCWISENAGYGWQDAKEYTRRGDPGAKEKLPSSK